MRRLALATAVVLGTLLGVVVLWELRRAIVLFLLSLAVAAAVRVPVERLARSGWPKSVGLTGTYLVGLASLGLLGMVTLGLVLGELQAAADDFVRIYEQIATAWPQGNGLERAISRRLPPPESLYQALAGEQGAAALTWILGSAFSVMGSLVDLIVIVVLSIYWSIDRVHFERLWLSLLPVQQRFPGREIWRALEAEIGGYFRAELVQSLLAGVLLWAGYRVLGLHYPTIAAVVAAVALLLPWLGIPVAVAAVLLLSAPAMLLRAAPHPALIASLAVVYTLGILLLLEVVVEPRLLNRRRYNSLLMAVGVVALADTFGILGLLLGPPLAVAVQILAEHLLRLKVAGTPPVTPPRSVPLQERLAEIQANLAARPASPPELLSLTERLVTLVDQAQRLGRRTGGEENRSPEPR